MEVESGVYDGANPEVFDLRAMPPQPENLKPGQLPVMEIRKYFEEGYLLVPNFFSTDELEVARQATMEEVDDLANKLYKAGKIKDLYAEYDFFQRLTKLEEDFPGTNVILHKMRHMPEGYRKLWTNERLLNLIEQLIGPDVAGNPFWTLRTKTPQNEATTVPWHQDSGYMDNKSYKMHLVVAWIPMLDANETNGCLQFAARGHRAGKIALHKGCWGGTWYLYMDEGEMKNKLGLDLEKDIRTISVPYGGMILFNNIIPHRSLPNLSNDVRWSLDLRWQKPSDPDGLYGRYKPLLMRSKDKPNMVVDWSEFGPKLPALQKACVKKEVEGRTPHDDSELDTTNAGNWMKKWEIVNTNRHTDKLFRDELAKTAQ